MTGCNGRAGPSTIRRKSMCCSRMNSCGIRERACSSSFRQPRFKFQIQASCHLTDVPLIRRPYERPSRRYTEKEKPVGLVKSRKKSEIQCGSVLIPYAVVVARNQAKPIVPRWQICVRNFPGAYRPAPIGIKAIQFVAEADAFR